MSQAPSFDHLVDLYDALVDWPKRLAAEGEFYSAVFGKGVRSLLDVACGTGRHAAMFHEWGLQVEGADISPAMIERCRQTYGESPTLRWAVRSFAEPHPEPGGFDAVICVGNSLALAPDLEVVRQALRCMLQAARRGGVVVVQVVNLWRLPEGPVLWQKPRQATVGGVKHVLIKCVHRHGAMGYIELVAVPLEETAGATKTETAGGAVLHTQPFMGLRAEVLAAWTRAEGAAEVRICGSIAREAYIVGESQDVLLVARK